MSIQKRIQIELGDMEYLTNGSKITVDSTNGTLTVKLDDYEKTAELTDDEVNQLLIIFNKLK